MGWTDGYEVVRPEGGKPKSAPGSEVTNNGLPKPGPAWGKQPGESEKK